VGQSKVLEPHKFFKSQGFGSLPSEFKNLKMDGCDLAYLKVIKSVEEEKEQTNKRKQKSEEKNAGIPDDLSGVSGVTTKTQRGKALKRHCVLCDGKLIVNWSDHKTKVHGGTEVQYFRCDVFCK
jgi:hypothetical protein